jgi:hypothetical protein
MLFLFYPKVSWVNIILIPLLGEYINLSKKTNRADDSAMWCLCTLFDISKISHQGSCWKQTSTELPQMVGRDN